MAFFPDWQKRCTASFIEKVNFINLSEKQTRSGLSRACPFHSLESARGRQDPTVESSDSIAGAEPFLAQRVPGGGETSPCPQRSCPTPTCHPAMPPCTQNHPIKEQHRHKGGQREACGLLHPVAPHCCHHPSRLPPPAAPSLCLCVGIPATCGPTPALFAVPLHPLSAERPGEFSPHGESCCRASKTTFCHCCMHERKGTVCTAVRSWKESRNENIPFFFYKVYEWPFSFFLFKFYLY